MILTYPAEFSGTLMGFDDFVSEYITATTRYWPALINNADMVLEDVTE